MKIHNVADSCLGTYEMPNTSLFECFFISIVGLLLLFC